MNIYHNIIWREDSLSHNTTQGPLQAVGNVNVKLPTLGFLPSKLKSSVIDCALNESIFVVESKDKTNF